MPRHIGIIMDGNGRWAKKRGLPRTAGHKKAAEVFSSLMRYCRKIGIEYVTVYAFSTENWRRPPEEVAELMGILRRYLGELEKHEKETARLVFLGDRTPLDADLCAQMEHAEEVSRNNTGFTLCLAINYGGRDELVHAMRALAHRVKDGALEPDAITEQDVTDCLYTAGIPDPDVILRTSGEKRCSNFLPWQSVYAELIFTDVLWPDFTSEELDRVLLEYAGRNRRYGGV